MTKMTFSRRGTLGLFGASAAIASAGPVLAMGTTDAPVLALSDVPLAWPQFHHLVGGEAAPQVGRKVTLRRDARHPFDDEGVAVFDEQGERLGYIARQHVSAVSWALDRGDAVKARISALESPVVRGHRIGGWGNVRIDLDIRRTAAV